MSATARSAERRRPGARGATAWLATCALLPALGSLFAAAPVDAPQGPGARFDPRALAEGSHRYRVIVAAHPVGTMTTTLQRATRAGRAAFRAASRFETSEDQRQTVELWFDAETLAPIETTGTAARGPIEVRIALAYTRDRVRGKIEVKGPEGAEGGEDADVPASAVHPVDVALPAGTLDQNELRYALVSAPLAVGGGFEVPIFDVTSAELQRLTLRVTGVETVAVPAGSFRAFRVEMSDGDVAMTWYVTTESPRRVVRQDFEAGTAPVRVELLP